MNTKRIQWAFGCLSLVTLLAGSSGLASAVELFRFTDAFASAFFFSTDAAGCVITNVFLSAGNDVDHGPPGNPTKTSGASLFLLQFDTCNFRFVSGSGFASGVNFQTNPPVMQATLTATIPVDFFAFPEPPRSVNVAVSMTWTGTAGLSRELRNLHFFFPDLIINSSFSGNFREAQATGSVSDGTTNFTPNPSAGADIGFEGGHEVRVDRH